MVAAIAVAGVTHAYDRVPVLRGVDLTVRRGEIVALFGANGAGKTTLLRIVATLDQPLTGTVRVDGHDGRREPRRVRACVGFVAHPAVLYADLTVIENLRFFAALHGRHPDRGMLDAMLAEHDLARAADVRVRHLSHGTARRAALARAWLHEPRVLLLDEAHSGLDPRAADALDARLAAFAAAGGAVLLASHDTERARRLADRVAVLRHGRLEGEPPPSEPAASAAEPPRPPRPSFAGTAAAIAAKDVRVELRGRDSLPFTVVFTLLLVVVLHFALPPRLGDAGPQEVARAVFPAVLWVALLLGSALGLQRAAASEADERAAWGILLSPSDPGAIFLGKWLAAYAGAVVVALVALIAAVVFLGLPGVPVAPVLGVTALGLVGWVAASVVVTALVSGSRAKEAVAPLLLYPLAVPLLVAAVSATESLVGDGGPALGPSLTLLMAYDVILLVVGFLAFAFAWESAQ